MNFFPPISLQAPVGMLVWLCKNPNLQMYIKTSIIAQKRHVTGIKTFITGSITSDLSNEDANASLSDRLTFEDLISNYLSGIKKLFYLKNTNNHFLRIIKKLNVDVKLILLIWNSKIVYQC